MICSPVRTGSATSRTMPVPGTVRRWEVASAGSAGTQRHPVVQLSGHTWPLGSVPKPVRLDQSIDLAQTNLNSTDKPDSCQVQEPAAPNLHVLTQYVAHCLNRPSTAVKRNFSDGLPPFFVPGTQWEILWGDSTCSGQVLTMFVAILLICRLFPVGSIVTSLYIVFGRLPLQDDIPWAPRCGNGSTSCPRN